ncbi:MAG: TnpV protein [Lachnospiraceae bacterium]|nr:TnpV protein [Lachnospiraceae bacterium]MDE6982703.1 TnpV protein [Lachnospiraceae bacterium]
MHEADGECHREVELAVKRIMEKEGGTEQLKKENPLEWVQRVNGIKARVEEVMQKM